MASVPCRGMRHLEIQRLRCDIKDLDVGKVREAGGGSWGRQVGPAVSSGRWGRRLATAGSLEVGQWSLLVSSLHVMLKPIWRAAHFCSLPGFLLGI